MEHFATFRDPDGWCFTSDSRVYRYIVPAARGMVSAFLSSEFYRCLEKDGLVPKTNRIAMEPARALLRAAFGQSIDLESGMLLEHERVPFVSHASEWCPDMLFVAGELTLELQLRALKGGLTLKDATPSNVLFVGAKPVFVDILSFAERPMGTVVWSAYAQFIRTFYLPLFLSRETARAPHEIFASRRDGIEPEEVYAQLSFLSRLSGSALQFVTLPALLGRTAQAERATPSSAPKYSEPNASEIAQMLMHKLKNSFAKLCPVKSGGSTWSNYTKTSNYEGGAFAAKVQFVEEALIATAAESVLDVGCNTGHFSRLAAKAGASVVSLDYDPVVVAEVFRSATIDGADILPLVMNLARPTPGQGWRNAEERSFLDRATGQFDVVMLLAVIHHLGITDGVPFPEIFALVATLARKAIIAEFIPPDDSMFQRIIRNKEHLIPRLQRSDFEAAFGAHFLIQRAMPLPNSGRIMYLLRKRSSDNAV